MKIWIDADACPKAVREVALKAINTSKRAGLLEVRRVIEEGHPCIVLGKEL